MTKKYGSTVALRDLSCTWPGGEVVAVIGLNGAGKTTLLRVLATILSPTRGSVWLGGEELRRDRLDLRRTTHFIPDFPVVFGDHTPLQHITMLLRLYEVSDPAAAEARAIAALRELDLLPLAEVPLASLSRGQIYKAAFAALVTIQPWLWLLDEPFASGLDPQGIATVKQEARAAAARGATVVYTTQILEIAERFADRLCVIDRGELRYTFRREELLAMPPSGPESLEARLRQFREVPE